MYDWFLIDKPGKYKCFTDDSVGEASLMSNIMDGIIIAIICLLTSSSLVAHLRQSQYTKLCTMD